MSLMFVVFKSSKKESKKKRIFSCEYNLVSDEFSSKKKIFDINDKFFIDLCTRNGTIDVNKIRVEVVEEFESLQHFINECKPIVDNHTFDIDLNKCLRYEN